MMSEPSTPKVVSSAPRPPRQWLRWLHVNRLPLAWVVLGLLVVQNAATTMLVQHTRRHPAANGVVYLGSVAVLISECLKLPTCLALIVNDEGGIMPAAARIKDSVFDRWKDTLRMSVPALCYGLQNLLFFVALSNLSATSYQLWSQTKTLFTAFFFVRLLGQRLQARQWAALGLLTAGVSLVQLGEVAVAPSTAAIRAAAAGGQAAAVAVGGSAAVGIAAVLTSSFLSGFANVYFERVLKQVHHNAVPWACHAHARAHSGHAHARAHSGHAHARARGPTAAC